MHRVFCVAEASKKTQAVFSCLLLQNPFSRCFPALSSKLLSNHLSIVFLTNYDYVVAIDLSAGTRTYSFWSSQRAACPTLSVFQNLSFSCFMPPRLEPFDQSGP